MTGHLVFTTVHANDVFDVLGRFRQFDIDGYPLASAISCILSQRLVRRLCSCAEGAGSAGLLRPAGCERCGGTGFRGRFALGELVTVTPRMKSLMASGAEFESLREEVHTQGAVGLRKRGLAAVERGWTTAEEVERVTADS